MQCSHQWGSATTGTRTPYPHDIDVGTNASLGVKALPSEGQASFGVLLRGLRMAAGLSQEALAERARISTEAVSSLERGTRQAPQRQTLALLIEALRLDGAERDWFEQAAVRHAAPRRRETVPSVAGGAPAQRLPAPLTSFVGRELDLTVLLAALSDARLLSLVGAGGVGKSRIALEAARLSAERFSDGVTLVELAPVAAGASVLPAFAAALAVAEEGAVHVVDRLVAACGDGRRLIVVDNCEHVLDAAAELVLTLLSSCPNVRVIATSREPLRISGEQILRLGPLHADAALQLFIDRARAVAPYLAFNGEALRIAGAICRRVDRIPLAIELAASRTDMLDLSTILKRLQERFKLLSARSRTMHPHHRTLRALVDWSYDLLERDEARVFRRLGIFAGGCRFDDAEEILAFDGVDSEHIFDVLTRLHDKSLIDVDRADPPRFTLLQTIHDYAQERLSDVNEARGLELRFATHYLELAVASGAALRSEAQPQALERLSSDADNLRAALTLSVRNDALRELGLQALGPLGFYWLRTGALTEGASIIESMMAAGAGSTLGVAAACASGAFIAFNRRRYDEGDAYAARAYEAAMRCGDEWQFIYASTAVCTARSVLGQSADVLAATTYERALRLADPWLIATAAFQLGWAAEHRRDPAGAEPHFSEALERSRLTGDDFMVSTSALHLGRALAKTQPSRAAHLIGEAIARLSPGATLALAACMESLSEIALVLGRIEDAARLAGIAGALRSASGGQPKTDLIEAVRNAAPDAAEALLAPNDGAQVTAANEAVRSFLAVVT